MDEISVSAFHAASKNVYKSASAPPVSNWPEEWSTTYYKEYPRFTSIALPKPEMNSEFASLTANRQSDRTFNTTGLTFQELSNLLQHVGGEFTHTDGSVHRAQASAGARYPIEMYLIVRFSANSELQPGVYHYNVAQHALEYLWPLTANGTNPAHIVSDTWATEASVQLLFTAVFWRSTNKYGEGGYRYICMEAGAMLQNAYLYAAAHNLRLVGYGGVNADVVEKLLRLDATQESLISSCLIGK